MLKWLASSLLIMVVTVAQGHPIEEVYCTPDVKAITHDDAYTRLQKDLGERPTFRGLSSEGHLLEVYISHTSGTWTVVVTDQHGRSCSVDRGTKGHVINPIKAFHDTSQS